MDIIILIFLQFLENFREKRFFAKQLIMIGVPENDVASILQEKKATTYFYNFFQQIFVLTAEVLN